MTVALPADVPLLEGWNVWDVLQSQAPIDPLPGSANDQLAAWVRAAVGIPDLPIALVSSSAAGDAIAVRDSIPELAGTPALGVAGSALDRRTIAFELHNAQPSIPWPHDDNLILDAAYEAAPAPSPSRVDTPPETPVASSGNTARPLQAQEASLLPLGLALGTIATIAFLIGRRA